MFLLRCGSVFLFLLLIYSSAYAYTETLNISATIEAPTCELNVVGESSGIINLGDVDIIDFESEQILTHKGKTLVLKLSNCKGAGWGGLKPTLKISGVQEGVSGNGVFRSSSRSTSQNIGVLLKYDATDYFQSKELGGNPFYWELSQDSGRVPDEQLYSFWLGLTRVADYALIRAGTVGAEFKFSFEWH